MDPDATVSFRRDYGLAQADVAAGVVSSRAAAAVGHWETWCTFCTGLGVDPTLQEYEDPIPFLQVFVYRYRNGIIAPSRKGVRSRTVEDALRSVGQTFASVGTQDPRLNTLGKIDFRIQRQLACYTRQDPPPNRVKPVPVPILMHIVSTALTGGNIFQIATADMIALAFFYLLRPGEYTGTRTESTPFRLCDVQLFQGSARLNLPTASDAALLSATFASLTFTTQKNGVKGEVIGLGHSGNPEFSPTVCLARRIIHLRQHNSLTNTPLASVWDTRRGCFKPIKASDITSSLKLACTLLGPHFGFLPSDISARSLRASGAMALLCAQVDSDIIRLLGRWRSDEMLRYLHCVAAPVMRDFSSRMIQHGSFTIHPNQSVPVW